VLLHKEKTLRQRSITKWRLHFIVRLIDEIIEAETGYTRAQTVFKQASDNTHSDTRERG